MKNLLFTLLLLCCGAPMFADTCLQSFTGDASENGSGTAGLPAELYIEFGCSCGFLDATILNSLSVGIGDCGTEYLFDFTYDGSGGTTIVGVCESDLMLPLMLPADVTTLTFSMYDCCGNSTANMNIPIEVEMQYEFTDDGTCGMGGGLTPCEASIPLTLGTPQCDETQNGPGGLQIDDTGPCGVTDYDNGQDFTFYYTATAADDGGTLTVTLDGAEDPIVGIFAYEGCPTVMGGDGTSDICADSDAGPGTGESVTVTLVEDVSYFFHISSFSFGTETFCINSALTPPPPPICGSTVYDSGGATGDYGNSENSTTTYCPDVPGEVVTATFTYFNSENNGPACYDGLFIHDGDSNASPLISPSSIPLWCWDRDDQSPTGSGDLQGMMITSTDASGCLTFVFTSDGSLTRDGYAANITCAERMECAATCADIETMACNIWVTPADTPRDSYSDIQANEGESCFLTPLDVSTAPMSVTQCWEYTHTEPGSSAFYILSGTAVVENGDVNGTNDCVQSIDNIEIFDDGCLSLLTGGDSLFFANAVQGITYNVCVTATSGNGIAEGTCEFQCMAHSVTPVSDPICGSTVYDTGGPTANYTNNENFTITYCSEVQGEFVTLDFTTVDLETCCDNLKVYDGSGILGTVLNGDLIAPASFTSSAPDGCLTLDFGSDGSITRSGWVAAVSCAIPAECATTCQDAETIGCNVWVTPSDLLLTNYSEIEMNGGEACFLSPIDVSAAAQTVTQCFEYEHVAFGSPSFSIFSETLVVENGDVNGTNDCVQSITGIEVFDDACTSLMTGAQGMEFMNAVPGTLYTICVTASAGNGNAEGQCEFQCMANSVTPIGELPEPMTCFDFIPNVLPISYCSGNNEVDQIVVQVCPDFPAQAVAISISQGVYDSGDAISFYSGIPGSTLGGTLLQTNTGTLSGVTATSLPGECITMVSNTDGFGSCIDESLLPIVYDIFCVIPPIEPFEFTCGVDAEPFVFCYPADIGLTTIAEICPDDPNSILDILINEGFVAEISPGVCFDFMEVYSGATGTGNNGTLVTPQGIPSPTQTCGNFAGAVFSGLLPGECLSFVFAANEGETGCESLTITPFSISCTEVVQSCASFFDVELYCTGNNEVNVIVQEVCADTPNDIVQILINEGEGDATDIITFYSGIPGSGVGGNLIQTNSGVLDGVIAQGNVGECLTMVSNTDAANSCLDEFYTQIEYEISCVAPPLPTLEYICGVDVEPFVFCYGNDLSMAPVAEFCPQSATETLSIMVNSGYVEEDYGYYCYDEMNVYSGTEGSGNTGTTIFPTGIPLYLGTCGDYAGATYTAANPGECIIFVITSDYTVNSCDDPLDVEPFSVSCVAPSCSPNPGTIAPE